MGAKRVVEPFEEFSQTLFHLVAEGRGVRTDGTFEVSIFDAYVVAGACIHEADGAYDIFHRVHLTGDECLHVDDEVGSGYESIRAIVRLRCVGGFPFDVDVETIGCCHEISFFSPTCPTGSSGHTWRP